MPRRRVRSFPRKNRQSLSSKHQGKRIQWVFPLQKSQTVLKKGATSNRAVESPPLEKPQEQQIRLSRTGVLTQTFQSTRPLTLEFFGEVTSEPSNNLLRDSVRSTFGQGKCPFARTEYPLAKLLQNSIYTSAYHKI